MMRFQSLEAEPFDTTPLPHARLEMRELAEQVDALPSNLRDALLAKHDVHPDRLSLRAVARLHGVSPQTPCNWAEKATQQIIERYGETDDN